MCVVSAGKQHYSLGTPVTCAHRRKTNAAGAKGSSLVTASAKQHREMNAIVFQHSLRWLSAPTESKRRHRSVFPGKGQARIE